MRIITLSSVRILLPGIAAILAMGLAAAPVLASGTWTVKPGGKAAIATGTMTLKDTKTGTTITCTSSRLSGKLKSGNGLQGTGIGTITSATFAGCKFPAGNPAMDADGLPWHINLGSDSHGVVHGTISHFAFATGNGACAFQVSGKVAGSFDGIVDFSYANGTKQGRFTSGNLQVVNSICGSQLVHNGDHISIFASFAFDPAQTITSP